jgi:F-type H+/Na+-transporting ATPase subunit alpha
VQFASDLDDDTKARIESGRKYVELLKQKQNNPMPFYKQVVSIYAANAGMYNTASVENTQKIEDTFLSFIEREHSAMLSSIESGRELTEPIVEELTKAIEAFKESHQNLFM